MKYHSERVGGLQFLWDIRHYWLCCLLLKGTSCIQGVSVYQRKKISQKQCLQPWDGEEAMFLKRTCI